MYKSICIAVGLICVLSACVSPRVKPALKTQATSHIKAFEEEDTLIIFALRAEELKDFKVASETFETLYEASGKKEYLYRALQNSLYFKDSKKVIQIIQNLETNEAEDFILSRLHILAHMQAEQYDKALILGETLVANSHSENDYMLVSDIYMAKQEYTLALKYLESAYLQEYSELILDRMSIILYVNLQRKKDAIAQLETHTRVHGPSIRICKRLIAIYSNEDNIDGLLWAYLRYYTLDSREEVAKQIIRLYDYKKEYQKLTLFLENSQSDDVTLLQLYLSAENFQKASRLARKLFEMTGEVKYLGESIIYEYESQTNKNDKVFLAQLSTKFEALLAQEESSLYLNYYGYILIDHDVDIEKGIQYVQRALDIEPDSSYYLDSLAWGYYKLHRCKESLDIIQKVMGLEGGDDPEVLEHFEKIKQCKGKK